MWRNVRVIIGRFILFDKIILQLLLYGSEIWGTRYAGSIDSSMYIANSVNKINKNNFEICYVMKNVDDVEKHTWASQIKSYYIEMDLDTFFLGKSMCWRCRT